MGGDKDHERAAVIMTVLETAKRAGLDRSVHDRVRADARVRGAGIDYEADFDPAVVCAAE